MTQVTLKLDKIKTDGGTQARAALNEDVVAEYAEAIIAGANMPPVTVFNDGKTLWLADGFHRYFAYAKARAIEIAAEVLTGTKRDAKWYSLGANKDHGLRRTNEDKREAVREALADKDWSKLSDREIATHIGVSHPFVAAIRSPAKAVRQQEHRDASAARSTGIENRSVQVESDSTRAPKPAPAKDISQTSKPSKPVEKPEPEHEGPTLAEMAALAEELQRENEELRGIIKASEADDLKAEAIKWKRIAEHAKREQGIAMDNAAKSQDREKFIVRMLRRCGKAVGISDPNHTDPRDIAAAVETFAKGVRRAA